MMEDDYDDEDDLPDHPPNYANPPPDSASPRIPKYRECLKNHAVAIGGHALDGCGEFMPAGDDGTIESLKCAACNCHRNFHRRDPDSPAAHFQTHPLHNPPPHLLLTHHPHGHYGYRGPTGYLQVTPAQRAAAAPPLALPSSSGGGGSASREEMEDYYNYYHSSNPGGSGGKSKRHRTKFSQEQKEKMLGLAVRLDWKLQKQDEELVQQLCGEIGVKRHVFKVWMHNNKHTLDMHMATVDNGLKRRTENMWALLQHIDTVTGGWNN